MTDRPPTKPTAEGLIHALDNALSEAIKKNIELRAELYEVKQNHAEEIELLTNRIIELETPPVPDNPMDRLLDS